LKQRSDPALTDEKSSCILFLLSATISAMITETRYQAKTTIAVFVKTSHLDNFIAPATAASLSRTPHKVLYIHISSCPETEKQS
jgi:hypothetical protein